MAEPMPASALDAIRARVAKTSNTYASLRMVQPSQPAVDRAALLAEVDRLTEERDQAIAHDRQPYPTQWAYDQACEALEKHRQRADKAEAALAELQGQNAMTEANFDAYVDAAALQENKLRAALEEVAFRSVQRDLADLARTALDLRPSTTEEGER